MKKNNSSFFWFWINRISMITGVIGFIITIFGILPQIWKTQTDVQEIQQRLIEDINAEQTLYSFFYKAEQWDIAWAYNLFSEEKKKINSLEELQSWFKDLVAFEWLKITSIPQKTSASQKTFLVEFDLKKRWKKAVHTKIGYTLKFINGTDWRINYTTTPLYENGWKNGACDFYTFPNHCE